MRALRLALALGATLLAIELTSPIASAQSCGCGAVRRIKCCRCCEPNVIVHFCHGDSKRDRYSPRRFGESGQQEASAVTPIMTYPTFAPMMFAPMMASPVGFMQRQQETGRREESAEIAERYLEQLRDLEAKTDELMKHVKRNSTALEKIVNDLYDEEGNLRKLFPTSVPKVPEAIRQ